MLTWSVVHAGVYALPVLLVYTWTYLESHFLFSWAPSVVAKSSQLMLCQSVFFIFVFFFCSWYLQDCQAGLHQILQKDGEWAAIEKLSFWFLNSFKCGKEVRKGHFCFKPSFTKYNMAAKRIYISKKEADHFWLDNFSTEHYNRAKICQGMAEIIWFEYKHGGARLTTFIAIGHC